MTTVVLGWDGLDYDVAQEYGLADRFAPHHCRIDTIDNPVIGKPHTQELWPAIITGTHPRETGIRAATEDTGTEWSDPRIDALSTAAAGIVPESVRTRIGRWLRNQGAQLDSYTPEYYAEQGLATVFDGRDALPIAVPNYRVETDDTLDLVYDRGAQLQQYLTITTDEQGRTHHEPEVPLSVFERRLAAEASKKLGIVETALQRDPDLVFVWLGWLDSVGHLAPTVAEADWRRRQYEQAARWTGVIRRVLGPDDDLLVVADHGLQDGEHTHATFFGTTDADVVERVESVLDVAPAIDQLTDRTSAADAQTVDQDAAAVRENLEDLGYL